MAKKSISSIELAALINELQFLVNGKIPKIYHQSQELLLQLHSKSKGKVLLKVFPGKFLCLTEDKEESIRPSGFCMQLRKYLTNATINALYQKDSERIVVFELEKENKYFLIIEFFGKGNFILTDHEQIIISTLNRQIWQDRTIKPKEKYTFPEKQINWKIITKEQLTTVLKNSEKRNLATSLATEIGLGGLYSEEVCKIAHLDKDLLPSEITEQQINKIYQTITSFNQKITNSKGYFYEKEITPFPLQDITPLKITETYNEAISTLNPYEITSPYKQKIQTLQHRVKEQNSAIKKLEEKIEENKRKGDLIYENYTPIHNLLNIVNKLKQTKEWSEIAQELKKENKIKEVNLKDKKIILEL